MVHSRREFELVQPSVPSTQPSAPGATADGDAGGVKPAKPVKPKVKSGPKKVSKGTRISVKLTVGDYKLFQGLLADQEDRPSRHVGVCTPFPGLFPPVSLSL